MSEERDQKPDEMQESVIKHLQTISELLGLRADLLTDLLFLEGSDWSFLIKTNALLETATVVLLTDHLGKPELQDFFAQELEMSQRIKMLRALDVISEAEMKMLQALGRMRNNLAHNAKETDFTFAAYFSNKDRKRSFADNLACMWPDKVNWSGKEVSRVYFVEQMPRLAVWGAMMKITGRTLKARLGRLYQEQLALAIQGLEAASPVEEPVEPDVVTRELNERNE